MVFLGEVGVASDMLGGAVTGVVDAVMGNVERGEY